MITHDYRGKVAFITGDTSGIGLAAARGFARAGANVVVAARGEEAGAKAVASLEQEGRSALYVPCDVCDEAALASEVERTTERYGRLDVAFNCAGAGGDLAPVEHTDQAIWDSVMATNARGVWLAMRYEIPAIVKSGGGSVST